MIRCAGWRVTEAHQILAETIADFHADQNRNGLVFALDRMAGLNVVIHEPEPAARLIAGQMRPARK
jgi:hypothetical protein